MNTEEFAAIEARAKAWEAAVKENGRLLAAVRERDNTIARVREVGLLGLDEIAQKSIDATVARMQDQLGCIPDDLGPDVMAKIVDSHIEQAELFAGPVLDALRAALDPPREQDDRVHALTISDLSLCGLEMGWGLNGTFSRSHVTCGDCTAERIGRSGSAEQ
ncbi:hypothetical protein [Rhodococcus sp. KRD162]|uniref:hypothetical protein n=1 Tax=Rhodococcus sp. KRD162 TaxID=2729725 RepID=UPI0019D318E9|nr:hypothetical protein [Rhodococcus sp. KRD162]